MYFIEPSLWISISEMHFDGPASLWYQSVESQIPDWTWDDFCAQIHDCFDRDHHESLIRQLFHVKQTSIVTDYISRFTELMDQLKVYSPKHDHLYFTMRFIDGLRSNIKSIVLVQCPKDLDTAATLALLQEELASVSPAKPSRFGDWCSSGRQNTTNKGALPLPAPPQQDKPLLTNATKEPMANDAKLSAIKVYRRAMGLCFKCVAPWMKDHKCSLEILLVVEAIWNSFDELPVYSSETSKPISNEQVFLALSKATMLGTPSSQTVRFGGILNLLDSGSFASFISESVASQLSGVSSEPLLTQVQVAGGAHLQSSMLFRQVTWSVDQCSFTTDFKVLPLTAYDVIIRMDWLELFSPMHVHWRDKWLAIPYHGQYSVLQGLDYSDASQLVMQVCSVQDSSVLDHASDSLPLDIQALLDKYSDVFQQPTSLPLADPGGLGGLQPPRGPKYQGAALQSPVQLAQNSPLNPSPSPLQPSDHIPAPTHDRDRSGRLRPLLRCCPSPSRCPLRLCQRPARSELPSFQCPMAPSSAAPAPPRTAAPPGSGSRRPPPTGLLPPGPCCCGAAPFLIKDRQ
jgi:hypothetical protein